MVDPEVEDHEIYSLEYLGDEIKSFIGFGVAAIAIPAPKEVDYHYLAEICNQVDNTGSVLLLMNTVLSEIQY